jgi:hypothetical protein
MTEQRIQDVKSVSNEQKTFDHYKQEDKYFFGGFLNNVDDNLRQVTKEFKVRLNFNAKESEDQDKEKLSSVIKQYFSNNKSLVKQEKAINILKEYFPVVELIQRKAQYKNTETKDTFVFLLDTLNILRDYYTHHYHKPITIDSKVYDFLDTTLLDISLTVKKKKVKNDKSKEQLKKGLKNELKKLINLKREELIGLGKNFKENELESAVFNHCLGTFLFKEIVDDKVKYLLKDAKKSRPIADSTVPITQSGLVFLMSFFLHRKEFQLFTDGLEGFKGKVNAVKEEEITLKKNSLVYMITHWTYSYYNFKGLKHRIKTDQGVTTLVNAETEHSVSDTNTKEALLTQIVDYLSKVPDEVYSTLSEKQQKEFEEDLNEYMRENPENKDSTFASIVSHSVIRKRYENKFNYFALRFLDEYAQLPSMRFMVNFGDYIKDRQKKVLESINFDSERILKKKIHLFEKLSLVTDYKKNLFLDTNPAIDLERFPLFPNPSYVIANNNIPFYINNKNNFDEYFSKKRTTQSQNKKNNPTYNKSQSKDNIISELEKEITEFKKIQQRSTIGLLSCNELPSMLYEVIVKDKKGADLENTITQKIKEQYDSIKDFTADSQPKSNIPASLLKAAKTNSSITYEGVAIDLPRLKNALKKELEITQEKIKDLRKREKEVAQYNKEKIKCLRKHIFYHKELGEEAHWLASDLIHFMKNKATWKGYMHSELQALLAFYETKKNDCILLLETIFNLKGDCVLTKDLKGLFIKHNTFTSFYKEYLNLKESFLSEKFNVLNNGIIGLEEVKIKKELNKIFQVFQKRQFLIQPLEEKKNKLYADAMNLSRGIFDAKPTMIANKQPNQEDFAAWFMAAYAYKDYQSFYDIEKITISKSKTEEEKKVTKGKYKKLRAINKIKIQDYYLKLMVDVLYKDLLGEDLQKDLKDFYVSKTDREKIKADAKAYQQLNDSFLWNKTVELSLQDGRITANPKLKDVGKYKRAVRDEKITTLLTYDNRKWKYALDNIKDESKQTHFNSLTMELQEYEKVRSKKLLKQVQQLEKQILEDYKTKNPSQGDHPAKLEDKGNPKFRFYITKGLLSIEDNPDTELEKDQELKNDIEILKNLNLDSKTFPIQEAKKIKNIVIQKALILIIIRNKIAHNQYPPKFIYDLATSFVPKKEDEYFACYFNRVFETITKELWENKK